MVVAHPDDETLWGGHQIAKDPPQSWHVICCTTPSEGDRVTRFHDALKILGATGEVLSIPDKSTPMTLEERGIVKQVVRKRVRETNFRELVTHGPLGEYGHPRHVELSNLVTEEFRDIVNVKWFTLSSSNREWPQGRHLRALEEYFGNIPSSLQSYTYLNKSSTASTRLERVKQDFISMFSNLTQKGLREVSKSDLVHIELSSYAQICSPLELSEIQTQTESGQKCRPGLVFESNPSMFREYDDRRYLILEHLPTCHGATLSVGCHEFNSLDYMAVGSPSDFVTVELDPKYSKYGSRFHHIVGDFLDLDEARRFDDIILFGVLGIPSDPRVTPDNYTLYERFEEVVSKVDRLLKPGGRVLIGPDLQLDRKGKGNLELLWDQRISSSETLKFGYETTFRMRTRTNAIIVLRKFSDR